MKLIFIIDSDDKLKTEYLLDLIKKSESSSFLFIKRNEFIMNIISQLKNASVIDISADYIELLNFSRDKIVKYFADFPRRIFNLTNSSQASFHNIFFQKGFSAWWLMNFADKAPEAGGIINRLFQIDIIKSILEKTNYDLGLIHSKDEKFSNCVNSIFNSLKISSLRGKIKKAEVNDYQNQIKLFVLIKSIFKLIASKYISHFAYIFFKSKNTTGTLEDSNLCFHSWYPAHWYDYGEKYHDKYYFDLPDYVKNNSKKIKPIYIFKLKWYDKNIVNLYKSFQKLNVKGIKFDFLDRYISIFEIIKSYFMAYKTSKILNSSFMNDSNKKIFEYNEINIFELAYTELIDSFLSDLPYNLVLSKALGHYLKANNRIKVFVNFLELYAYARGFINEINSDPQLKNIKTIAFQHSTVTKYNLHYNYDGSEIKLNEISIENLPVADYFILSGKNAFDTLSSFKINPAQLLITGSPRYDFMLKYLKHLKNTNSDQKKVLIATVSDRQESIDMLELCLTTLSEHENVSITFKTHPMNDMSNEIARIMNSNDRFKKLNYRIRKDNIYELIVENDILITSNSMVGLEAIVLGSDVVLYGDAFKINLSPLADSLEFRNRICYSSEQFKNNINKTLSGKLEKPSSEIVNKLIEENYYKLDGLANWRILKALEDIIDECN